MLNAKGLGREMKKCRLKPAMNPKTLGIEFSPVVAFAVNCKPAETKPAVKYPERSRSLMDVTCRLAANVGHGASNAPDNARVPDQV
jgi:hypothetical protein